MKKILTSLSILLGLAFLPLYPAYADHYEGVYSAYDQCNKSCGERTDNALSELSCNYYSTKAVYEGCQNRASTRLSFCTGVCSDTERATKKACRKDRREDRKECRQTKKEETRECKEAKKAAKTSCKDTKKDEKEACKDLSGKEKKDCKKQARQNKKECKKDAKEIKKACKSDAKDDKSECKSDAKDEKNACIDQAESVASSCLDQCRETYDASCVEERQAYDACGLLARPIFEEERSCKATCDSQKEAGLEGYSPYCSNGHAGDNGATITFINASDEVRHYYRPEPYPTSQPTGALIMYQTYVTSLDPGESYTQEVVCGIPFTFSFKDNIIDGSNFVGEEIPYTAPCCEEKSEVTIVISN